MPKHIVFSDIQGNQEALENFVNRIRFVERDDVIYLGDVIYDGIGAEQYIKDQLNSISDLVSVEVPKKGQGSLSLISDVVAMHSSLGGKGEKLKSLKDILKEFDFVHTDIKFPDHHIFLYGATRKKAIYALGSNLDNDIDSPDGDYVELNVLGELQEVSISPIEQGELEEHLKELDDVDMPIYTEPLPVFYSAYFINPGSIGNFEGPQTYAIVDTDDMYVRFLNL